MKLLVVMNLFPWPPTVGTAVLAYNNVKELSGHHFIHLVCLDNLQLVSDFPLPAKQVHLIPRKKRSYLRKLIYYSTFSLIHRTPLSFGSNNSKDMRAKVDELLRREKFDAILCYGMDSIQHVQSACFAKVIALIEDPASLKLRRMARLPIVTASKRFFFLREMKLFERVENMLLPKVAKTIFLSKGDLNDLKFRSGSVNVGTVTYGVDKKQTDIDDSFESREKDVIVFSGNMYHLPNVDGALFFLNDIFPLVLRGRPNAVLWIVGSNPDERITKAAERFGNHVLITGRVEDMSDYLKRAQVSICPIRLKIGVQTKVLEALSLGTPVVTTSAGNSGVGAIHGVNLLVSDQPGEFAISVISLLNGDKWSELSLEGRGFVEKNFTWKKSANELEQHILSLHDNDIQVC